MSGSCMSRGGLACLFLRSGRKVTVKEKAFMEPLPHTSAMFKSSLKPTFKTAALIQS